MNNDFIPKIQFLISKHKYKEAEVFIEGLLTEFPNNLDYLYIYTYVLFLLEEYDKALLVLEKTKLLFPKNTNLHHLENVIFQQQNELDKAEKVLKEALSIDPHRIDIQNSLGCLYLKKTDWLQAILCFEKVEHHPEAGSVIPYNLAKAYRRIGNSKKCEELNLKALKLSPKDPKILLNLCTVLREQHKLKECLKMYMRLYNLNPSNKKVSAGISRIYLLLGDFKKGWNWLERRVPHPEKKRLYGPDRLKELENKIIYVFSELGFGDTIQFSRFLPKLSSYCKEVHFCVYPKLKELYELNPLSSKITTNRINEIDFKVDLYIPIVSLGYLFNIDEHSISYSEGYLKASSLKKSKALNKLKKCKKFKVGIFWQGNPKHSNDVNRSISLENFLEIFINVPKVEIFSLQVETEVEQIINTPIINLSDEIDSFAATASIIQEMDLIISVDSAIAHLSGALGKTTWIILSYEPDWRWLLNRSDSPWYDSVTLFRQEKIKDWSVPIKKIRTLLKEKVTKQV